eukprot:Gb_36212 [translate_table: standard]
MGKGLVVLKPSRSDEVMDADYQLKIAEQVKSKFEELAPKRPRKPDRSEFSDKPDFSDPFYEGEIPELKKFEQLECQSEPLFYNSANGNFEPDEFVETEYYKDLNAVDKQHHTPGNGFIKLESNGGSYFRLAFEENGMERIPIRSNPATNDWIPSHQAMVIPVSPKPTRSN